MVLGITGGIASGKSAVLKEFKKLGAKVLDSDKTAREVVRPGGPALKRIIEEFGEKVLRKDGTLDRAKLGSIVFADPAKRKKLEKIIHPEVLKILRERVCRVPAGLVAVDVPLLFEAGWEKHFHKTLAVWVPQPVQLKRLMLRNGLDRAEAVRRIRSQWPLERKTKRADFVIDNSKDISRTRAQAKEVYRSLKKFMAEKA